MTESERERLVGLVEDAFGDIPRPACTKHVAEALDDEWGISEERLTELQQMDPEQRWQVLKWDDLWEFGHTLFWMSAEGFRFYFPAFLRATIENWHYPHDTVQQQTMTVIGNQPSLVECLTAPEASAAGEILTELAIHPAGEKYDAQRSIQLLEDRARYCEQQTLYERNNASR